MDAYIRFMAPVVPVTTNQLLQAIDNKLAEGATRIHLLISSPGGSVFHGLTLHNFLKGIPAEVYTYNFGSVDSIGVILFCSGVKRFTVPHARFLIHPVNLNIPQPASFDEKTLEEKLKGLQIDQKNIARVIADTVGHDIKTQESVEVDMNNRTTLNPDEAVEYGLVHEIKPELIPAQTQYSTINEPAGSNPQQQILRIPNPQMITIPQNEGFTISKDLLVGTYFENDLDLV